MENVIVLNYEYSENVSAQLGLIPNRVELEGVTDTRLVHLNMVGWGLQLFY